jgi:hypothetical protein
MRRRKFIALMGASVAWPFAALAQEPGRMYRVGGLNPFPRDTPVVLYYLEKLRQRGFIEGQNLMIETRDYGIHPDLISEYAAELVRAQCDVISAAGGAAIRAAQQATKTIPIVGVTDDMVGEGFVDSLVRPGGNTTGVSILATELDGKRQELLIEAVPELRRMAALADSNNTPELNFTIYGKRRARTTLSFQFSWSPKVMRSQRPSTRRRHRVPPRSTYWPRRCCTPILSLSGTGRPRCAGQTCINGPNWRRKAASPPTDRASVNCRTSLPDRLQTFCAAPNQPIFRSSSRRISSWSSISGRPTRLALKCRRRCSREQTR